MSDSRLDALRNLAAQDPANHFIRYGLAQELANTGQLEEAWVEFESLLAAKASYVPAYYHAAQTLQKLGRTEEARGIYRRGMQAAGDAGDDHTRSELEAALDLLG